MVIVFLILICCNHVIAENKTRNYEKLEENQDRIPYFLVEKTEGIFGFEDLINSKIQARATASDVTYYFYTQSIKEIGIALYKVEKSLPTDIFNPDNEVLITIHGWTNDFTSPFNSDLKSVILDIFDVNFIIVDWSKIAKMNYVTAKYAVPRIGKYVGHFIELLSLTYDIPYEKISIVSHSLGAHVAGIAGKTVKGEISQIIGLDPAGPLVSISDKDYCLDSTDAQYVQVIHTNGGLLGLDTSIGHADYFPNGGKRQPGCGFDISGSCSHSRAYKYYAESIRQNQFISRECTNYEEFSKGKCQGNYSLMGGYNVDKGVTGDFYLHTNKKSPFAKGEIN